MIELARVMFDCKILTWTKQGQLPCYIAVAETSMIELARVMFDCKSSPGPDNDNYIATLQ